MIKGIIFDLDDTLYNSSALALKSRLGGLKKMQELGLKFVNFDKAAPLNTQYTDYQQNNLSTAIPAKFLLLNNY